MLKILKGAQYFRLFVNSASVTCAATSWAGHEIIFFRHLKDHHHWMSITMPGRFMSLRWIAIILLPWSVPSRIQIPSCSFLWPGIWDFSRVQLIQYNVLYCRSGSFLSYVLPPYELLPLPAEVWEWQFISREELSDESHRDPFSFKRRAMRKSRIERLWSRTFYCGKLKNLF